MNKINDGITIDSIVNAAPEFVATEINGEVVILNLKDSLYYGLNSVGSRIWALVQEPCAVNQIEDILLTEYDVNPEVCHQEVVTLLTDMLKRGLIKVK
jgi:hypothetical protein